MTWGYRSYLAQAYASGETTGQSAWNPVVWPFRVANVAGFVLFALQIAAEIMRCILMLRGRGGPPAGRAAGRCRLTRRCGP